MNTKFAGKVLRMFSVFAFLLGTVSTPCAHVKALNDTVFVPHTLSVWQENSGRWWVENDYYRIELTEFSSFVVKSGDSNSEWKIFSNWPWLSSHAVTFSGQFYRLLYGNGTPINIDVLEQTVDCVVIRVMSVASADKNVVLQNIFTFHVSTPVIKVDSELIGAAESSIFEAITYNLFVSPGGDISNDWYAWPGGEPNVFPYNSWDTIYTSEFTPVNNHIYIATYDLNKKQGVALISNFNDTSEFTTDIRYGRASVEGTYGAYDPDSLLSMAGDRKTSFYIYIFDVEDFNPVAKIESFLQGLPSNQSPVADAGGPYTVFVGDIVNLDASTSSDPDGDILTYAWDLDNDGQYDDATGVISTTSFNQVGTHTIGLRVTDDGELSDTDTATVTVPIPGFSAFPVEDCINFHDWPLGKPLLVEINDPATPANPDYTNQVSDSGSNGSFPYIDFSSQYDMKPGDIVTVTQGTIVKTHTVTEISVEDIDINTDIVSGLAKPNSELDSWVCDQYGCASRHTIANQDGTWFANFRTLGNQNSDWGVYDFKPGTGVEASQTDEDGDKTVAGLDLLWTLKGFYQPVDMNGVYNIVKGGSTVPFKFEVFAGSAELTDIAYVTGFTYIPVACDSNAPVDVIETTVIGVTSLRYDATSGQFIYNWKTPKTAGQCYRVTVTTLDSSSLVAYFKFK